MVANYTTFVASTEQDVITLLDTFLVNHVGWYRADTITDTSSDRDYVWISDGEPDQYTNLNPRYIRIRATANELRFYAYATYTNSSTFTQESFNATNTIFTAVGGPLIVTVIADKERVLLAAIESTGRHAPAYVGRVHSLYSAAVDPYPNMSKGTRLASTEWDESSSALQWYGYSPSATLRSYKLTTFQTMADSSSPNKRTPTYVAFNQVVYTDESVGDTEIRGYVRGCYQISNQLAHGSFVTLASGTHIVYKGEGSSSSWAFGPVTDPRIGNKNRIPPSAATLDYDYRGFGVNENTIANWRFDTNTSNTFIDQVGTSNLIGTNSPTVIDSPLTKAVDLNGTDQLLSAPGDSIISADLLDNWTVEVVFMPDTLPGSEAVLVEYGASTESSETENILLYVSITSTGNVKVMWEGTGLVDIISTTTTPGGFVDTSRYNYLAVVKRYNGVTYDLEVWHAGFGDSSPILRQTFPGLDNATNGINSDWYVGASSASTLFFDGKIDEMRVSKTALTGGQIASSSYRVRL